MAIWRFSIPGYSHLYRSLLRFSSMTGCEAKELIYLWNTANLDSFRYAHDHEPFIESGQAAFINCIDRLHRRPYRTEVQLYKALEALRCNIIRDAITDRQREAVAHLRCIMQDMEYHFYLAHNMDIADIRTVYAVCRFNLIPWENEPSVCVMLDWLLLPSA